MVIYLELVIKVIYILVQVMGKINVPILEIDNVIL